MDSMYTKWYNGLKQYGLENEGGKGYHQPKGGFSDKQEKDVPRTYLDKLIAADDRKGKEKVEPMLDNYISTLLTQSRKEIHRDNGNVGKHADRIQYRKSKKFNEDDQIKACIVDDTLELLKIAGIDIGFIRRRCVESIFVKIPVAGRANIREVSKLLTDTEFDDVPFTGFDVDAVKCYVLLGVDFLPIPSKQLVFERNEMTGGLFIKYDRTMKDIADLNLEEHPLIFLEGIRQTSVTTEVERKKKKYVGRRFVVRTRKLKNKHL